MKFNNNHHISSKAKLGNNVRIGDRTIVYDNVIIGDDTVIANDCIIGEPTNDYYHNANYENPETVIGPNSLIRSHCIIYAGSQLGTNFSTGHRVTIRENTVIGSHCRMGTLCDIQGNVKIGDYCWLHSNVHIGQTSTIGNFVFIYPYVVFTNDPHPPSNICLGPSVDDYAQIAVFSVLLPNVKVGQHALVGAGSIVAKDVPEYMLVLGNPAKPIKDIRDLVSRETGQSHYPWPENFERGMPWEGVGYKQWMESK